MKKNSLISGALILLLAFGTGCSSGKDVSITADNSQSTEADSTVEAFGIVKSTNIKNITLDFPAEVTKVNVINGQRVTKNELMVTLDLRDYQNQIEAKEKELNVEKLQISKLENTRKYNETEYNKLIKKIASYKNALQNNSDPNIKNYLNKIKYAQEIYDKSLEDYKNKEALYKLGGISKSDLDSVKSQVNLNKENIDDLEHSIDIYKEARQQEIEKLQSDADEKFPQMSSNMDPNINLINQQKEKIAALESELKLMKEKLSKSYIKDNNIVSDIDNGLVDDINYAAGDFVSTSLKVLSIMSLDNMVVEASIPEEFIGKVKPGAEAVLVPDSDKSRSIKGKVASIANKAVTNNGETTVTARITFDDKEGLLLPGYNVDIKINIDT